MLNYAEAQTSLTIEEALEKTLENNYNIQIARLNEEVAKNNSKKLNSGYLPTLSANGNYGWTYNGGSFETVQGENSFDPNSSFSYGAGVNLNYIVWDGKGRKYNYLQSQKLKELSAIEVRQIIETTMLQLNAIYYDVTRLESMIQSMDDAISISVDRLTRAEFALDYGQGTQLDVLNATVDLNADSINLINAQQQLAMAKRNFNFILGEELSNEYTLTTEIKVNKMLIKEDLLKSALQKNAALASINTNMLAQEYALSGAKAALLPIISANAGYDFRGNSDPNGAFVRGSSSLGPSAGLTLNWNIFNGESKTRIKNSELNLHSMITQKKSTELQVKLDVLNAYETYTTTLIILNTQRDNVNTAQRNFERSEEAFRLAQLTSIEFRQAQLNLLNAKIQLTQSQTDAKNAELQLLAVAGEL